MNRDFWAFRTMITPVIIEIMFWVGIAVCVIGGFGMIYNAPHMQPGKAIAGGILFIIFGPIGVRIYCEILIIFFRINETLTEIKHAVERREPQA
jgi:hypothetical protein